MVPASDNGHRGQPNYCGEQEKADDYQCFKDPAHRRAPVYTLVRVLKRDPQREMQISQRSFSERWVPHMSSQLEETAFHYFYIPEHCFFRAFVISFKRCQIPRGCRVCPATDLVKHKCAAQLTHGGWTGIIQPAHR